MNHTPTPWTFIKSKTSGLMHVESSIDAVQSGVHISSVTNKENAEFIVTACNAHEDLVKALELAQTYLEDNAPHSALHVIKQAVAKAGVKV